MTRWILLRGLTREVRHWGDFTPALQHALPAAEVHAIDLPGNGTLWQEASPWRVELMAEHARQQLRTLGLRPPYQVLAMSLGAMVATAWVHAYPHEVSRGVLINTSLRPFSSFTQRLRPANYGTLVRLALTHPSDRMWEEAVLRLTTHGPVRLDAAAREALLQRWVAWRREQPVSRNNALRQLVAAARFSAPRTKPPVPLLVLTAAGDELVNPDCSRQLARSWQCSFAEHPDAGHDLPLEDAPWVIDQVLRWLATATAR